MSTFFTKTNWTLIVTFIVVAGNAILPLLSVRVETVIAALLIALATIFHVSDVNAAVAAAKTQASTKV
jgi:hypothetical protein